MLQWPRFEGTPIAGNNAPGDAIEKMVQKEQVKAQREYKALQAKKAADAKVQRAASKTARAWQRSSAW